MNQSSVFVWSAVAFGTVSSIGIVILCASILVRGESPWLLPGMVFGSAVFLSVPSVLLLIWGRRVVNRESASKRTVVKNAIRIAVAPLVVCAIGLVLGFLIIFLFPSGMAG
jgi:hypothetical protein